MQCWTRITTAVSITMVILLSAQAEEQWPQRPVTLVIPFGAGGNVDTFGRIVAHHLAAALGQPFVVVNRVGASGNVALASVAKASADGYTLVVGSVATHGAGPSLFSKLSFDTVRDFQPIGSIIADQPHLLVVRPRLEISTVAELIAYLKANPGKLAFGSAGVGTSVHLAAESFMIATGTKMTHVPFRSSNDIMTNLAGGHIDLAFDNMPIAWPQAKAGNVRAIAVTSAKRSPTAPEVPAVAETLPGFDVTGWIGLFAPAGTPRPIVDRLATELARVLELPEVKTRFAELGAEPTMMSPDTFTAYVNSERAKWAAVVKSAGIKLDQ